jgi:hypothetical protein
MQVMDPVAVMKLSFSRAQGSPRPRMHGRGPELQGRSIERGPFCCRRRCLVRALEDGIARSRCRRALAISVLEQASGGACPNNFSSDRTARARLTITRAIGFHRIEARRSFRSSQGAFHRCNSLMRKRRSLPREANRPDTCPRCERTSRPRRTIDIAIPSPQEHRLAHSADGLSGGEVRHVGFAIRHSHPL